MSYNFIYQIGSNSEIYSTNYDSKEECNVAQSKWMSDEKVKNSVLSIKIKSCGDYNADDGIIPPVYNINANAEQIKANNKDNTASLDKGVQVPHYTLLEPINGVRSIPITPTSFADYIQSTFNVLFGIFIVWSIFRLAYGGVLFMTSDIINKKLLGKEMIINSIKYFFLAVFTYTIFFIINPDILNNKITNIVKDGAVAVGSGVMDVVKNNSGGALGSGGSGVGGVQVGNAAELFAKVLADEQSTRAELAAGNITINNNPCNTVGSKGCTNVGLIDNNVINEIIQLEKDCKIYNSKCEVIVSGGTEWWSHGKGIINPNLNESKHVPGKYSSQGIDLNLDTNLSGFLKTNGKSLGADKHCYDKYEYSGEIYCDEKNNARHFHANIKI